MPAISRFRCRTARCLPSSHCLSGPELGEVMSAASAEAGAAAPSRAAELEAQVAELTQKLERETYRSAQLAAQVKEKTRKHGELVRPSLLCWGCPLLSTMPA